jgi:hypothetical protein
LSLVLRYFSLIQTTNDQNKKHESLIKIYHTFVLNDLDWRI